MEQVEDRRDGIGTYDTGRAAVGRNVVVGQELSNGPHDGGDRQHEIHDPGRDGAPGHAIIFRGAGQLRDGEAARRLDGGQPEAAIGTGARKDHRHRAGAGLAGQGVEQGIDREPEAPGRRLLPALNPPVQDGEVVARPVGIDSIGLDSRAVLGHDDRQRRLTAEESRGFATPVGIQVLDDDERHARIGPDGSEKLP
jgi:hypothetical protein